jgi:hypothetical protein
MKANKDGRRRTIQLCPAQVARRKNGRGQKVRIQIMWYRKNRSRGLMDDDYRGGEQRDIMRNKPKPRALLFQVRWGDVYGAFTVQVQSCAKQPRFSK